MAPPSEEQLAAALAAAVEDYAAGGRDRSLQRIQECLDDLLYHRGSDGLLELSVSESRSGCLTLVGIVVWVEEQTAGPLEAVFCLHETGAVKALTVRAGDGRIPRRDAPPHPLDSWRKQLRFVESRPTIDEDWEHVLRYEFD